MAQTPAKAYCMAHGCEQHVDEHWFAMWVDGDGDLRTSPPGRGLEIDFGREDTVLVCGQGCALTLTERWLHTGLFDPPFGYNPGVHTVIPVGYTAGETA